jgi:hypothetical protein
MRNIKIKKTFTTKEEYYASSEYKEVFKEYEHVGEQKKAVHASSTFIAGYVIEKDPATNYGRNFKLLRQYKIEEGLTIIAEEKVHSVMSNGGFYIVVPIVGELLVGTTGYGNTKQNRKLLAEVGHIITSEYL